MNDIKTIKWILKKTKSQSFNFICLNILNILYSSLGIYLIVVSKNIIDSAVSQSIVQLKRYVIELIIISLLELVLKAILMSITAVSTSKLEISFKQNVLDTIVKRNYQEITKLHTGELMTRTVSDVNIIIDTLMSLIPDILSLLTKLICSVVILFNINKEFVIVLLVGGLLLFIVVNLFKPFLKRVHKKIQQASSNVRLFFKEVFENLIVIKIFQTEDVISKKSKELQYKKYDILMKRRKLSILSELGFDIIFKISYLYALIWCTYNLFLKKITMGGLTSVIQLITQIQIPIIELSTSVQGIFSMIASAERIIELENIKEDKIENPIDSETLYNNLKSIKLEDVNFTYKNKKIFKNANLEVNKGDIVAIYGESGIGKSTLLKLILGIIEKQSGDICFLLNNGDKQAINNNTRNMFTYVPQGKFILTGTIRENITFVNENISEEELNKALEVSNCKSFIEGLEEGLETNIGERGKNLSEGQIQRLAIARAIASNAPILILDEITSSLDRVTEKEVLNNIRKLKNRTCIIVTHRSSISDICDREFVVEDMAIKERDKKDG